MDTEAQLIERIAGAIPSRTGSFTRAGKGGGSLQLGIGDDAAVVAPNRRRELIWTCDAFVEGIHFLGSTHPPESVGYKALVRATSDVAAMGGIPRLFLLTLALPAGRTGPWLDRFLTGMGRAARSLHVRLAGGDTTKAPLVFISIAVLGDIASGLAIPRSGARPGDMIYVSGRLGRAQLGLELIRKGVLKRKRSDRQLRGLLQPHLYPEIRVELGAWLARHGVATAMIDISDGLSTDLGHVCAESGVGARVWAERVPRVEIRAADVRRFGKSRFDPLQMALHGGEDYELLFTVSPRHAKRLRKAPGSSDLTAIGEITREKGLFLVSAEGGVERLLPGGWDPFRKQ